MQYIADPQEQQWKKYPPDGERLNLLFDKSIEPTAALNRLNPGRKVSRHSHPVDQYQVILEGSAYFPEVEAKALSVHYADARCPYGPFVAGPDGLLFLELTTRQGRIVHTDLGRIAGTPEFQKAIREAELVTDESMKAGRTSDSATDAPSHEPDISGRSLFFHADDSPWEDRDGGATGIRYKTVWSDGPGKALLELIEAPSGAALRLEPARHGEFRVVIEGDGMVADRRVGKHSFYFTKGEQAPSVFICGEKGATVLRARFWR